ncbi:ABC-type transport system periplasmic substrate-binding protein (probable substrate branched-chain amino acids) [Natronomonas pharaonis DSM 2160]|uniref:ABC-type transport system periplasmic substrate-binding protein (Probable substrate branched-chain amino acids) n=1 Tax=Natronomonas pharaonis (strain ATCC 35678 / DSM 2160 / CIP 103997 / JCM 8858 / NBRC 14720 / NCIMB 2260 / Gabara) TaxID=348780 RepID=A0A1U7EY71_NATPD|nr:ABC transporter substrate-binding protein [Natronomonas pharaonis]CAI50161.1 ABC-type transport system periplasmic substrate-binding protein (probable substrate branched-chain amino acids) [Natronomonas pharaonis DSM 2160]
MTRHINRRNVLKAAGAASMVALAGCNGNGNGNGNGDGVAQTPDSVMVVGFPQSGIQLFRDYYGEFADDYDVDIIVPDGLIDSDLPGDVDNDMDNVIGTEPAADGPGADFFADSYEDEYGEAPSVFTSHAYDAMAVSVLAAVAAGENDGEAIRDRMATVANPNGEEFGPAELPEAVETVAAGDSINYQGASSSVDFDENGDIVSAAYDIVDFQGGQLEVVDSLELEAGEIGDVTAEDPVGVDEFEAMVGVLMPETGDLGPLGGPIRDGALLAATQINDADLNVSVDTSVEDTQTDPTAAISSAESLVNAGYPAVVGPAGSDQNFPVSTEVYVPNSVVGISPASTAPGVTELDDDGYIFRTAPSDALQGPVMAEVVMDRLGHDNTATLYLNDEYGQALEASYVNGFEDLGGEVFQQVSFEPEQPSYSSQWAEVLDT